MCTIVSAPSKWGMDTSPQVYVHVHLITQVQKKNTHAVLEIVRYISCYMLQSDVIV